MKRIITLLSCIVLTITTASARDLIKISATKKTASSRSSSPQDLARGRSISSEKDIYYLFKVQPLSTDLPGEGQIEWMVLAEGVAGNSRPRTHGSKRLDLTFGQVVTVESESFELRSREWTTGRTGTIEEKIVGYGVRVLSTSGDVLAEKYSPSSVRSEIDWNLADPETQGQGNQPGQRDGGPPRRRRPRL